ncbi:hypothetical protein DM02DRAFT_709695 [Periconia macrospinosa]|uniref:Uncharacterized protein n=1 Tax=Periconia macrospinosa TaxID=97972 RepID=A0A2V1DP79_9PLEO|nr:hypothetical protein DM02DRAFT_709695 [Periconia macrospinosa]
MASNTDNPAPVAYFPYAEAALERGIADELPNVSNYNWVYNDPMPVNFTAVEIITFLPTVYCNHWVARRFVNNGISNGQHHEIFLTHRKPTTEICADVPAIGQNYLNAMRPAGWRLLPKEQQKGMWTRKAHRTPSTWNRDCIEMNTFRPDGHDPVPSVPIIALLQGVKKIPTGEDAADLTRAIEFGVQNKMVSVAGGLTEYMFPEHLPLILSIIGRTVIESYHLDGAIAKRYERRRRNRMNAENALKLAETSQQAMGSGAENSSAAATASVHYSPFLTTTNRFGEANTVQQAWYSSASVVDGATSMDLPTLAPANTQFFNPNTLGMTETAPNETAMAESADGNSWGVLLRDYAGMISPNDVSLFAQAVRFAQQEDQMETDWAISDLQAISAILLSKSMLGNDQNPMSDFQQPE